MATPARQLEDRLDRIERMLAELLARERAPAGDGAELVTKRAAARLLGVDRATTLEGLIRSGRIATVPAPGGRGLRIPRAELERVLRAGVAPAAAPAPKPRRAPRARARAIDAAEIGRAIRDIPIPRADE